MSTGQSVKRPRVAGYQNRIPSESGEKLYLKSKMADVHFTFSRDDGSIKRIPAHKSWLAAASEVFEAMFYGDLKEKDDVQVVDVSDAAFEEFLQFFYISEIELTAENVAEVMGLGHKYNVTKCVDLCVQFVKDNPTKYICTWLNAAILYKQIKLLKLCDKHIAVNTGAVFKSTDFLTCEKRVLEHILKMNLLSCSETEVFEACMAWVKARSKRNILSKQLVRAHLGDLYYEIRFKSMTMQQFATLAASYDSVLSTDFKEIANLIALPDYQVKKFNKSPRKVEWNKDAIIECNREPISGTEIAYLLKGLANKERTTFSTNEPLLLGGFVCGKVKFGEEKVAENLRPKLTLEVKIVECTTLRGAERVVLNMKTSLESKGTEVLLSSPVFVKPGLFYRIYVSEFPEEDIHYSKELLTKMRLDSNIKIDFQKDAKLDGKALGLISSLFFNRI